jgi:uncharacterized FlaG/YvyC family protein
MDPISLNSTQGLASTAQANAAQSSASPEERARNRSLAAAASAVNEAGYAGEGRAVLFSVDQTTRQPVIRIVDTGTNKVVEQWPPEYLLELAADTTRKMRDSG